MGILSFFHKVKMGFVRKREPAIPYVDSAKRYGNNGEDSFVRMLRSELPECKIKRNVVIMTTEGTAEIDCLVLYRQKLFAIEVKRWKGCITECEDGFLQEKTDRWTDEIHTKFLKSPFKQLNRAIYLLRKQIPVKAWVNPIVFFEDGELESISVHSDHIWFRHHYELTNYIRLHGSESCGTSATEFFQMCLSADYLYARSWDKSMHCVIVRHSLQFETPQGVITPDRIASIRIYHYWSYDDLVIKTTDNQEFYISRENAKIQVIDNGCYKTYALCKLDYIELGGEIAT